MITAKTALEITEKAKISNKFSLIEKCNKWIEEKVEPKIKSAAENGIYFADVNIGCFSEWTYINLPEIIALLVERGYSITEYKANLQDVALKISWGK